MNNSEIRNWLDDEWAAAMSADVMELEDNIDKSMLSSMVQTTAEVIELDNVIHRLVNSKFVSLRYALVTQLVGKIADPSRNLLALQLADGGRGAWDARSFSTTVVVPWVSNNQYVLGTSAEPYASKPLRRERLERDMPNVRSKDDWNALVDLFTKLEEINDSACVEETFRRVLKALVRRLISQAFNYPIPHRISLPHLQTLLNEFLSTSSGGLHPHAVTAALMRTVGRAFSLFSKVTSQGINEADNAAGVPGDVICYRHEESERICLIVEVKDQELRLAHVDASSLKIKQADEDITNVLFSVPGIKDADRTEIDKRIAREWALGTNIYMMNIGSLVNAVFVLLDESWRIQFVREIGEELDRRQNQNARKTWYDLLVTAG